VWAEIQGRGTEPFGNAKYTKSPSVEEGAVTGRVTFEGNGIRLAAVREVFGRAKRPSERVNMRPEHANAGRHLDVYGGGLFSNCSNCFLLVSNCFLWTLPRAGPLQGRKILTYLKELQ
jgi:hypothetical protein